MKKIIALCLAVLMVLGVTACQSKNNEKTEDTKKP